MKIASGTMQILHDIWLSSKIFFILVLCIASTEERRISNAASVEETASVDEDLVKSVSFFRTSLPKGIFECLSTQSILRCMKIYVLQKMEAHKEYPHTGNLTRDFLDQFSTKEAEMSSLFSEPYKKLSEQELNKRLVFKFQQFFKNSDIKLHFLPGIVVRIIPSKNNKLKFSFKKQHKRGETFTGRALKSDDEVGENTSIEAQVNSVDGAVGDGKVPGINLIKKRKNKKEGYSYKNAIIQMAVPVMVMPAILMGSIMPFLLPVLKMATIVSMVLNNSAFIAALIYAARTHANAQEEQHISYGSHTGYH